MELLIAVVGLNVRFEALSQSLAINETATAKGNVWSVIFSNPINSTSELATNTGRITPVPTLGSTSISLDFGVELLLL